MPTSASFDSESFINVLSACYRLPSNNRLFVTFASKALLLLGGEQWLQFVMGNKTGWPYQRPRREGGGMLAEERKSRPTAIREPVPGAVL